LLTFPAEGINCVEKIAGMHVELIDYGNVPVVPTLHLKLLLYLRKPKETLQMKIGKFFSASESKSSGTQTKAIFNKKYESG
jgi:dihydrolipoamide dehydrogenase